MSWTNGSQQRPKKCEKRQNDSVSINDVQKGQFVGRSGEMQKRSTNTRKDQVVVKLFLVERRAKRPQFAKKVQRLFLVDSGLRPNLATKAPVCDASNALGLSAFGSKMFGLKLSHLVEQMFGLHASKLARTERVIAANAGWTASVRSLSLIRRSKDHVSLTTHDLNDGASSHEVRATMALLTARHSGNKQQSFTCKTNDARLCHVSHGC
jgi:hypothetical protein